MPEVVATHPAGSPGWHEQRKLRVGGSEVAAVLGISPWESPFSLWHRKAGALAAEDLSGQPPVYWGNVLEPVVRDEWLLRHTDTHHARPELGLTVVDGPGIASPDAVVTTTTGAREVLEIKTAVYPDGWGPTGGDEIPIAYRCQTQWYMGLLGLPVANVAVLISGHDFREYRIQFDADDYALMRDAAAAFVDSLVAGERPGLDSAQATQDAVRKLHPDIDRGNRVDLDAALADALIASKRDLDAAKATHRYYATQALDAMGDAQYARHPDGHRVAYRAARDGGTPYLVIDRNATKEQHP